MEKIYANIAFTTYSGTKDFKQVLKKGHDKNGQIKILAEMSNTITFSII